MVLTNHLTTPGPSATTSTGRSCPSCPATSGYKLTWSGGGSPQRQGLEADRDLHAARARSRRPPLQRQDPRPTGSPSTSSTPAAPRPATSGSARRSSRSRSGRSRRTRRRAAPSGSSSRPATRSRSSRATIPDPTKDASGAVIFQTGKLERAAVVLRLPRGRPAGAPTPSEVADRRRRRRPGRADDPVVGRRHGVVEAGRRARAARRCRPGGPDRPALAARGRPRHPRGGQPIDRRLRRAVRPVGRPDRGRLLRRRLRRPPRIGARLVQRGAAGRPLGERGVRLVLRPRGGRRAQGQGGRRRPDAGARGGPHPAQRVGSGRSRG